MVRDAATGKFGADTSANLKLELRRHLEVCAPCEEVKKDDKLRANEAALAVSQALQENATVLAVAISVIAALFILPRLFALLPPAILTLMPLAARTAITQIPALLTRLRGAQAANEGFFKRIVGL